jgi:isovaleryl-CoA dehydrogenase
MVCEKKRDFCDIIEMVRSFAEKEIAPYSDDWDEKEHFPEGFFKKLAGLNILGLTTEEEYGGSGLGAVAMCAVMEELSYFDPAICLSYLAHELLFVHNLHQNGSKTQKEKYLPGAISGSLICGMAMTEPNFGSDATGMATRSEKKDGHYILNGTKMFITNGPNGDAFLVYARSGEPHRDLSLFIVEKNFEGFQTGKKLSKMGMRASPTGELIFTNCRVPAENLVCEENKAVKPMMRNLDIERVGLAAMSLGIARAARDISFRYSRERIQFERPILDFQAVSHKVAALEIAYLAAESLVYEAAAAIDRGERARRISAAAKVCASEAGTQSALLAIQVLGGYGYIREFPVERLMRDAKLLEIGGGTSEILRNVVVKELDREII